MEKETLLKEELDKYRIGQNDYNAEDDREGMGGDVDAHEEKRSGNSVMKRRRPRGGW